MKSTLLSKLLLAAALVCGVSAQAAYAHDRYDNGWRPAPPAPHVVRSYNYVYYPAQQVYYSPAQRNWYWANGRGWEVGSRLPYGVNLNVNVGGIPIVLRSDRPYVEHVYVEQTYGRPWRSHNEWQRERHHEWREDRREYRHHHDWR